MVLSDPDCDLEEANKIESKDSLEKAKHRLGAMINDLLSFNREISQLIETESKGEHRLLFLVTCLRGEKKRRRGFVFNDRDYKTKAEEQTIRNAYMAVDL